MKTTIPNVELTDILQLCLEKRIAFASYRLPLSTEIVTLIQFSEQPAPIDNTTTLNEVSGFVISPFDSTGKHKTWLLKPDLKFTGTRATQTIFDTLKQVTENKFAEQTPQRTTSEEEYTYNVKQAVEQIKDHKFRKVVVSKILTVPQPEGFSKANFFIKLCDRYKHAFVHISYFPETGCWCGASPEILIKADKYSYQTVSLAGTQIAENKPIQDYSWSEKELDEQAIVTDFIEQTLVDAGVGEYTKSKLENYQAANLIHLKSGFSFPVNNNIRLSKLISILHPTPSVGGLPGDAARKFILTHEKHDRSYYSGYLGPLHIDERTALFVNLRCMKIDDQNITLYSGAGITEGSIARNEWIETENKFRTLKQVIFPEEF